MIYVMLVQQVSMGMSLLDLAFGVIQVVKNVGLVPKMNALPAIILNII